MAYGMQKKMLHKKLQKLRFFFSNFKRPINFMEMIRREFKFAYLMH